MALTPGQQKVLREIQAAPSYRRASPKVRKALIEAALVESNLSTPNQANSDRDSEGVLQQRPSQGWGPTSESNTQDAEQFLRRAMAVAGKYGNAGALAQAVQRSAFPGRYNQRSGEASSLLGGRVPRSSGGSQASAASVGTTSRTRTTTTTTPGVDNRVARAALISSFLEDHNADPVDFAVQANALKDVAPTSSTRTVRLPSSTSVRTSAGTSAGTSGTSAQSFGAGRGNAGRRGPVAHMTSEGGPHPTAGLAGFPARDYFAHPGTAAVAPINGKVVRLSGHDPAQGPTQGPHGPLGYSVYIQGDDGHTYFLTHMGTRNVKPGQRVRAGQKIGTVANYDKYGTPSHIHMGVD